MHAVKRKIRPYGDKITDFQGAHRNNAFKIRYFPIRTFNKKRQENQPLPLLVLLAFHQVRHDQRKYDKPGRQHHCQTLKQKIQTACLLLAEQVLRTA